MFLIMLIILFVGLECWIYKPYWIKQWVAVVCYGTSAAITAFALLHAFIFAACPIPISNVEYYAAKTVNDAYSVNSTTSAYTFFFEDENNCLTAVAIPSTEVKYSDQITKPYVVKQKLKYDNPVIKFLILDTFEQETQYYMLFPTENPSN